MSSANAIWRSCSTCKKPIEFQQTYYACSVSTCNRTRHGFCFCSVSCWDAHVPMMRHRESWAEQHTAPTREAWEREQQTEQAPHKASRATAVHAEAAGSSQDVLIVVSKLKQYIKQQAAMHTADTVHGVLSGPAMKRIDQAPIDRLIVTNTIPIAGEKAASDKIVVLSVARLLAQAIRSIHEETSVSKLFV